MAPARQKPPLAQSQGGYGEAVGETVSVDLLGVRPRRQACDEVELSQEATYDLVDVIFRAELLELSNDAGERGVNFGDRVLGVVLTLPLEAPLMFDELFPIESGATRDGMHARWPGLSARVRRGGCPEPRLD